MMPLGMAYKLIGIVYIGGAATVTTVQNTLVKYGPAGVERNISDRTSLGALMVFYTKDPTSATAAKRGGSLTQRKYIKIQIEGDEDPV